jgi:hypothetical protein
MPQLPDWQPLDAASPPTVASDRGGRVVAVVASERAIVDGWGASAALDLARGWSRQGARVMLVDCGLDQPSLHTAAGVPNREGLTDATFHGASVARVARPLDDGAFFLITAGAPVADAESVAGSERWRRLSAGMTEAGVTVALYVRDGDGCAPSFLGAASDIVVLGAPGEDTPSAVDDLGPLVRGFTGLADAGAGTSAAGFGAGVSDGDVGAELPAFVAPSAPRSVASPIAVERGSGGAGRMILFVILAIVVAALLGVVLTSGLG